MIRGVPYDAEIEYLECDGTSSVFPYIDTGIVGTSDVTFTASIYRSTNVSNECAIGSYGSGLRYWASYFFSNTYYLGMGSRTDNPTPAPTETWMLQELKIENGNFNLYSNGSLVATRPTSTFSTNQNIYIGCMNYDGVASFYFSGRIGFVRIYSNGVLVRDYIPVRVGTTGYLYDRVSKKLFGNLGTGDFVLGPDKAAPVISLHRYVSESGGNALGKMGVGAKMINDNLWYWPSKMIRVGKSPSSVWTPQTRVWYGSMANNGYANTYSGAGEQTFTSHSYHNYNASGYAMVQFFALQTGTYTLHCDYIAETYSDVLTNRGVMPYIESGDAFVYKPGTTMHTLVVSGTTKNTDHGTYKTLEFKFTIPSDVKLCGIFLSPPNTDGHRAYDIWNVSIIKD